MESLFDDVFGPLSELICVSFGEYFWSILAPKSLQKWKSVILGIDVPTECKSVYFEVWGDPGGHIWATLACFLDYSILVSILSRILIDFAVVLGAVLDTFWHTFSITFLSRKNDAKMEPKGPTNQGVSGRAWAGGGGKGGIKI